MWPSKHYLSGLAESIINAHVTLPTESSKEEEWSLTSYFAILNYMLKRYATDDNIVTANADIRTFEQQDMTAIQYAWQIWTKKLRCIRIYTDKMIKHLFIEIFSK